MGNITEPILLDKTGQAIRAAIVEGASIIADKISGSSKKSSVVYGFHVDSTESDPRTAVTYLKDAVGMTPAQMDYLNGKFDYGSWGNVFFMPRPCMVRYDGTVDYYLDPNDYDKKENGDVSALGDSTLNYGAKYPGNAMMEWGKYDQQIWTKVMPDAGNPKSGSVFISNIQVDADYTAYPFINNQGILVKHFYTAIYNGAITAFTGTDSNVYYRLRSIPRRIVMNSTGTGNSSEQYTIPWEDDSEGVAAGFSYLTQVKHEVRLALNNNPTIHDDGYSALRLHATAADNAINNYPDLATNRASIAWFTEVFCDIQLINNLLVLIGKSLNTQDVFGNGNMNGNTVYSGINNGVLYTGSSEYVNGSPVYDTLNKSGLFWGTSGNANAVKVFGMENWWGNQFRRYAGHINKSNGSTQNHFIKQTFGMDDGSGVIGYNTDGTSYIDTGVEVPATGYIKAMYFINSISSGGETFKISTFLPGETHSGSATIYWCDYCYKNTGNRYPVHGGTSYDNFYCGEFYIFLGNAASYSTWAFGASISYKPVV